MRWTIALMVLCAAAAAVRAEVTTREETREGRRLLVMENAAARIAVAPDPGGTVVEFVHKKTGTNFVYGGENVLKGRLGGGWKDYYTLQALDQLGKGIYALPYKAEFREGKGYKAIYVSCEAEGRRFEREMRLADDSAELIALLKITNISNEPLRLQIRWHTYSTLDDKLAESSCIIAPGPEGQARKIFIGSGWDHQFITSDGYWLAVNYNSGQGLWMTFKKEQSCMHITWTDYNHARKGPSRGAFVAEPYPQPILAKPGESVEYESSFYPVVAEDRSEDIPLGVLTDPAERDRARKFLSMVRPNLAAIGPYTMTPGKPPAGADRKPDENRFDFSHRRRDRFALRPWGILDAMMAVPSLQEMSIRCRYYARLFDDQQQPQKVSFRLSIIDAHGKTAKVQQKDYTIEPAARVLDVRDDIPLAGLSDGWYKFVLEGFVEGEQAPIHRYEENRRLVGEAKPAYDKMVAEKAAAPLSERPFVTALRKLELPRIEKGQVQVPVGVEEAGGVARDNWPVRLGVPFPQGMLPKDASFALAAPDGTIVPVQTEPMSTWLDGSLKWLLVSFEANVPASGHVFYTLKNLDARGPQPPLIIIEREAGFDIDGGAMFVPRTGRLLGLFEAQDLWWEDAGGRRYYFQLKGEGAGIVVEENGPLRGVLKATGWYFDETGRAICMGELRLEVYRGKRFMRLYHTVMFAGDPWKDALGSYGLRFSLQGAPFSNAQADVDGAAIAGNRLQIFQRNSDGCDVLSDGRSSFGRRSAGSVLLVGGPTNPPRSVALHCVDFWQMAPKKLLADAKSGTAEFHYWPREAGAMSFLPREDGWIPSSSSAEALAVGMSRCHEFVIDMDPQTPVCDYPKVFCEPVLAVVPPKYLASTRVALHLAPYDPDRNPTLERVISDTIDHFQSQRELFGWYGEWTYGGIPNVWRPEEYRWLDFGRYAWILNEEDIVHAPWLCFMRSGDRKYLKFAEINTRHLMEVGTIRWNPVWPESVGLSRRHHECIWLGGGDTGHSMLDPFMEYWHVVGYRPAWEACLRMAGAMAKVSSGSWRYISNPIAGLTRMYLETQNRFYKEHADRLWNTLCNPERGEWWVGDHGNRMALWYSQINPDCKRLWKEWTLNPQKKDRFDGLDVLAALYLETGEQRYAQAIAQRVPKKRLETITQHVLANLRELCYIGEALAAAQPTAPKAP